MARQLALALINWPLLNNSFVAALKGFELEWDAGPLHCHLQFAPKGCCGQLNKRPMNDMINFVVHKLTDNMTFEELRKIEIDDDTLNQLDTSKFGKFWWLPLDTSKRLHQHAVDDIIRNHDNTWNKKLIISIARYHARIPDLRNIFKHDTRPFEILNAALSEYGYVLSVTDNGPPLVVPSMWKINRYATQEPNLILKCL
jgi:hypothetical protein